MSVRLPRLLDSSGGEARRINPISVKIVEKSTPLSTATMVVLKQEEIPDRSYVELFVPGRSAGIFRTRIPQNSYGGDTTVSISLEHAVCEVGDWIITKAINESVMSLPAALSLVFSHYRGTRWQLGSCASSDDVVCNINVGNVLSAILSLVAQAPKYYLDFDFGTTPWTINVVKFAESVTAEGRLSRNVVSARVQRDDSKLFTRVYLEGLPAIGDDDIGHMDADTISQYGVIETVLSAGDYTEEEAILVASTYLERHKRPRVSININGLDFYSVTGEPLDALEIGKLYRLAISDVSEPFEEHITQLQWQNVYDQPAVTINLSEEAETAIKIIHDQGAQEKASANLSDSREKSYQEDTAKRFATGTLSIAVSDFSSPQDFTVNISGGLSTVNYGVFVTADNESSATAVCINGLDYGVYNKSKTSFGLRVSIPPESLSGLTTVLLRWFAVAK